MKIRYRRNLWPHSSKYYHQWAASTIERGRFEGILLCLHWMDSTALAPDDKRNRYHRFPFISVSGFLEHLRVWFQVYLRLYRTLRTLTSRKSPVNATTAQFNTIRINPKSGSSRFSSSTAPKLHWIQYEGPSKLPNPQKNQASEQH
jgi:hypothetical protein